MQLFHKNFKRDSFHSISRVIYRACIGLRNPIPNCHHNLNASLRLQLKLHFKSDVIYYDVSIRRTVSHNRMLRSIYADHSVFYFVDSKVY